MADWMMALMHVADITQPMIMTSHSMGSLTTLECVSRYVDCVHRIALVATVRPMKVLDTLLDAILSNTANVIEMMNTWSHPSLTNKPSSPGPDF